MNFISKEEFLAHYGVPGMKWGVRHDRKSGDIRIRKGTHFKRLSVYDESKSKGHAYVNYLKSDVQRYKGFLEQILDVNIEAKKFKASI